MYIFVLLFPPQPLTFSKLVRLALGIPSVGHHLTAAGTRRHSPGLDGHGHRKRILL